MSTNNPRTEEQQAPTLDPESASLMALARALEGSMMQSATSNSQSPAQIGSGSRKILGIFDTAETRRHRDAMEYVRDKGIETEEALRIVGFLSDAFLAHNFESEAASEQLLKQYSNHPLVLSAAPYLIQLARQMRVENMHGINQAGQSALRRKIEQR